MAASSGRGLYCGKQVTVFGTAGSWSWPTVCCLYCDNVENSGMRVNMNKTKVMISGERQKSMQKAARWPCGVCTRGRLVVIQYSAGM